MEKIILYSPALGTMNIGDQIIADSAKSQISFILDSNFYIELSTQTPLSLYYMRHLFDVEKRFVLGSNLLKSTFWGFKRQWDVTLLSSFYVKPSILIGAGWWQYGNEPNFYTKILYKKILNKDYIHSVRDEYTKNQLRKVGINNVLNTGCPTMWSLDKEHCKAVNYEKSENVVFTITDYNKSAVRDKYFVEFLLKSYKNVYFWPQGLGDYEYLSQLNLLKYVEVVPPSLIAFDAVLESGDVDYIGTRLHGGIRALQKGVRTLIIGIDNRAQEKQKDFNLPVLMHENIEELGRIINSDIKLNILLPDKNIDKWKAQFL